MWDHSSPTQTRTENDPPQEAEESFCETGKPGLPLQQIAGLNLDGVQIAPFIFAQIPCLQDFQVDCWCCKVYDLPDCCDSDWRKFLRDLASSEHLPCGAQWEGLMLANRARVPIDTRVFNHTIPALETVSIQVWDIAWSEHSFVDQAVSSGHPKSFSALLPPVLKHAIDKIAETSAAEDCDFSYHIISYYNILQLWRPVLRVYVRFWEGICCWPA